MNGYSVKFRFIHVGFRRLCKSPDSRRSGYSEDNFRDSNVFSDFEMVQIIVMIFQGY